MFEQHPPSQTRFKHFVNKSAEELKTSKKLGAHGSTVMMAFSNMVDNIDDVGCLVEIIKSVGRNHMKRIIPKDDFEVSIVFYSNVYLWKQSIAIIYILQLFTDIYK